MRTIQEPSRRIPVIAEVDVVVCGGGPGGLPAAIAAARHGAKTLLIERYGFLGGLATAGLVAPILGHHAHNSSQPIVEGLLREITERMHALGGAPTWEETLARWGINFDAETFKRVADLLVQEAGVELLLHTLVTDVVVQDGRIAAVIIENKSGRQAIAAKVVVDATGDADVAYRAGAPTKQGRDFDGKVESMGSFMHLAGLPSLTDEARRAAVEQVRQAMAAGKLRFYNPGFLGVNDMRPDHTSPNMTRFAGDPTDGGDMTQAELSVRRDVWDLVAFLRDQVPGMEGVYLAATSPQVGPRESRQIVGGYALTGQDVHAGAKFADAIARGSWWVDIHCPLGNTYPVHLCIVECPRQESCPFWAAEHGRMFTRQGDQGTVYPPDGDWYDIPYRCLVPNAIDNLLVSGRCISATHEGMAGARVMGTCFAIGQAAGTAAALAAQANGRPRDVDVAQLRAALGADGALV
ncbi:MAG: FAD-dependent oxidoreductase [Chloroflexi bacterium]|nr:FAD-dependent oxidoreductase [Chloroflexota bacterium]